MTFKQLKTLVDSIDLDSHGDEEVPISFIIEGKTGKIVKEGILTGFMYDLPITLIGKEDTTGFYN